MTALPDVLLPYQQRLWQAIDGNALSVHEKSRRTGFSWALGAVAAATAGAAHSAGGQDVLYMGYEKDMTREFIGYVAEWAKAFQVAAGEVQEFLFTDPENPDKSVGAFRIRFDSGFEVVGLPSVARALRGKQGLVILDEAAFMDDLAAVLKAALALLIWGGKVVVVSTHFGEENAFNGLVNDVRAGRTRGAVTRTTFDEACAEGLGKRVFLKLGLPWSPEAEAAWRQGILDTYRDNADEELNVIPNPTSGVYLPRVLVEARCVPDVPVVRWKAPEGFTLWAEHIRVADALAFCERELLPVLKTLNPDEPHALGSDFGRVRDLTVDWLLAIGRDLVRRPRLVLELREVPHEQQRQILFYILDRSPKLRAVKLDAGGNGSYIAEATLQHYGECVEPVQLSDPWYREHMPRWKAGIEDAAMLLPRDREIVDDHCMVKLVRGVAKIPDRRRNAAGEQRHGDAAIASALAFAASEAEVVEYGYQGALPAALRPPETTRWHDRPNHDDDADAQPRGRGFMPEMRGGLL